MTDSTDILLQTARQHGFELAGVAPAGTPSHFAEFRRWIEAGHHAGMDYLARRCEQRRHPESVLPGVRSLVMLGVSYRTVLLDDLETKTPSHPVAQLRGIAEYARGGDYHDWIRHRLNILSQKHRELFPGQRCRGVVDTAPILERDFAVQAGLGHIGKNTMLIHTNRAAKIGSKLFLAALLSTASLRFATDEPDDPCGDCRLCLDACPVSALTAPFRLDARRCLNYWTIEQRGGIPPEIHEKLDGRFFGCDACQAICPWNSGVPGIPPGTLDPTLIDEARLHEIAAGSPLQRRYSGIE